MMFSFEDKAVIKNDLEEKGWTAYQFWKDQKEKGWPLFSVWLIV